MEDRSKQGELKKKREEFDKNDYFGHKSFIEATLKKKKKP